METRKIKRQPVLLGALVVLYLAGIAGSSYENWRADPGGNSGWDLALFVLPILLAAGLFYAEWK